MAEGMARRLQDALRRGSYLPTVGRELQSITAAATAGWLAYDAGWQYKARRWWLETCHFADFADVPDVRVSALAAMALQASNAGDGRETVDLIQAAEKRRSAIKTGILAVGHAQTGDRSTAISDLAQSRQWLDHERRGNEPFWLDFWGLADLAWHETRVALAAKQGKAAEVAARTALASVDATSFPRNHTLRRGPGFDLNPAWPTRRGHQRHESGRPRSARGPRIWSGCLQPAPRC
jgi:hypothetical protein